MSITSICNACEVRAGRVHLAEIRAAAMALLRTLPPNLSPESQASVANLKATLGLPDEYGQEFLKTFGNQVRVLETAHSTIDAFLNGQAEPHQLTYLMVMITTALSPTYPTKRVDRVQVPK